MARTGQDQATAAQQQYMQNANQAFQGNQAEIGQAIKNQSTLQRGGAVGADPWLNPTYLANQNKLTANATSGENDAAAKAIKDQNIRSGGMNTGAALATTKDLALRKMRMADTLNAQRSAGDYNKNVGYQERLAQAPLGIANAELGAYGTSTGGQSSALGDLTQFGLASYGPWNDLISGLAGAGGAIGGAYAGK